MKCIDLRNFKCLPIEGEKLPEILFQQTTFQLILVALSATSAILRNLQLLLKLLIEKVVHLEQQSHLIWHML